VRRRNILGIDSTTVKDSFLVLAGCNGTVLPRVNAFHLSVVAADACCSDSDIARFELLA